MTNNNIIILSESHEYSAKAESLAKHLGIRFIENTEDIKNTKLRLVIGAEGLSLTDGTLKIKGDFSNSIKRIAPSNLNRELLSKAARIKKIDYKPIAIDATAGMGEDSIILAALGFTVYMYEYNAIIAALLRDSLERAEKIPELSDIIKRMILIEGDSINFMSTLDFSPDVVLLDPMFPERRKSSLVKKKFQLLQQLETPCSNEDELLQAAIAAKPHKIIIKRPVKGDTLTDKKPSYSLSGKAIRYDCIVLT